VATAGKKKPPGMWAAGGAGDLLDQPLGRGVMVLLAPLLVGDYLAVQLVYQLVHRSVEVFV
jgi:hypothetical protein